MPTLEAALRLLTATFLATPVITGCTTGGDDEVVALGQQRLDHVVAVRAYYQHMADCLTGQGIPSTTMSTGDGMVVDAGNTESDRAAYALAKATCEEEVGPFPEPPPPPTEEELRWLYAANVDVADCLHEHGFAFVEPPSEEVFVQTYRASLSGGPAPWHPYAHYDSSEPEQACPQVSLADRYQG